MDTRTLSLITQELSTLRIRRLATFVSLPAEIRNEIVSLVLSEYSGHVNLHAKDGCQSGNEHSRALGPLALLLVSRRLKSEIHAMVMGSYAIHFPPRLPPKPAHNHLFHSVKSATIKLDTSSGNGRILHELGKFEQLVSLELRYHRSIFGTLERSLHFSPQFQSLRSLKLVDLKKLGRSEIYSSRRPISEDNYVIELSTRIIVFGMAESGMQHDAINLEKEAKKLRDRIQQWTPERNLDISVWPTKKMVRRALWRANECRVELYTRDLSIQEGHERSYGTKGLMI
ncbi:hypothetical protein HII31_04867 [Pseudocercospora fuligena]|uniref:F-box domain-containing protein n=1 Tax=Pseudocercospora fuligena TaxID=685502 RepID=A0A8H6VIL4_9PEZI|nr:hypothetical protein HII31_04867 [Pseudocercospora fuligena]